MVILKISYYVETANVTLDFKLLQTLEDVADAIRNVGAKFGMPVLDLNHKGGFYISNATFRAQYGGNDKLHPNQAFDNEHLAPMIARFIESNI